MKASATVLITGAGTVTCQSVIKGLRTQTELPVRIVTVDASEQVAGRYFSDAFYRVPSASDPGFVDALLEICVREEVNLLVPIVDYEFAPLSASTERFRDAGCLVAISAPDVIKRANDKLETYRFFLEHGFGTARSWSGAEAVKQSASLPYPLFVKPAVDGRSSLDCYRVEDAAELGACLDKVPIAIVQQFVEGREFTADVLAGWNGEVLGGVIRERIETKGGVSYKGRTVDDPEMMAEVIRMAELLSLRGPANIQAFRTTVDHGSSPLVFNEINPRFSGALALTLAAGLNSPLMLAKLAVGIPVVPAWGNTRAGVTMLRYWNEVFVGPDGSAEYPDYHLAPSGVFMMAAQ